MSSCVRCGNLLVHGAKFCTKCGAPNEAYRSEGASERKQEYVGQIKKCPSCGAEVPALTGFCPSCGHELFSTKVQAVLQDFIDSIDKCDRLIANCPATQKTGWKSWNKAKRCWWVILNIVTLGIPLLIYSAIPLLQYNSTPKLSADEKLKASLIENYSFPNDRESILEAILFIKSKMAFLATETIDKKTAYWARLWFTKAGQLFNRAEILFPGDSVANEAYREISDHNNRVLKAIKFRTTAGILFLVVAFVIGITAYVAISTRNNPTNAVDYSSTFDWPRSGLFEYLPKPDTNCGKIQLETDYCIEIELYNVSSKQFEEYVQSCRNEGFSNNIMKTDTSFNANNLEGLDLYISHSVSKEVMSISLNSYSSVLFTVAPTIEPTPEPTPEPTIGFSDGTYQDITIENFIISIPDYWEEEGSKEDYLQYYAEKGDSVAMLSISFPLETDDNYDVSFDGLYADNENMITAIESFFTKCVVFDHEVFETDFAVKGILYRFTFKQRINLFKTVDGSGYCFCFPSENDRRWFFIYYTESSNVTGREYKEDYMKLISSIREKP